MSLLAVVQILMYKLALRMNKAAAHVAVRYSVHETFFYYNLGCHGTKFKTITICMRINESII